MRTNQKQIKHSIVWVVCCGEVGRGNGSGEMEREGERGCNRNAALVWGYVWDGVGSTYVFEGRGRQVINNDNKEMF